MVPDDAPQSINESTDESSAPPSPPRRPGTGGDRPYNALRVGILSIVLGVLILGGGAGVFFFLSSQKAVPTKTARAPVRTTVDAVPARFTTHAETLVGYGRARPLRMADVPAEIAATVEWVSPRLESGARVEAGEELVRLDTRDARSTLAAAEARLAQSNARLARSESDVTTLDTQIAKARSEVEVAQRNLASLVGLLPNASSESEVDQQRVTVNVREQALIALEGRRTAAIADQATARAEIAGAQADLERSRNDLARAVVHAPYAGTIRQRTAQTGQRVTPGAPLFSIVDLSHVEVPISLPGSRRSEVAVGAAVELRLRENDAPLWTGTVTRVSPGIDPERRTFDVFADVVAADGSDVAPIAPGAFLVASVAGLRTPNVIVVPRESLVGDALYVAKIDPDAPVDSDRHVREALTEERHPTIVRRLADVVLIGAGVEVGELIVTTGVDQIADGTRVLLFDADAARAAQADDGADR